jgi:FkbM family methyltransferase
MISYAQNFEDVLLRRLFPDQAEGFYIDVGAGHPVNHSVTKHFYDRGWRGVNVEPTSHLFATLCADRPRDVNLNLGLSESEGSLTFHEAPDSLGRSTFSDSWRDGWHRHDGCAFVARTVPVTTLARLCELHADRPIDFLKVDVEGHEREVLAGADFRRWRPRAIVVEGGPDPWEPLLLSADYLFAAFDGINRYYLRAEDAALRPALAAPVSVLDDFVPFEYLRPIEDLRGQLDATRSALAEATAQLDSLRTRLGPVDDLGPGSIALARWVRRTSRRHPRISSLVRRMVRVA